ncbi:MAG TPA: hypothetical protein VFU29_18205 [Chitinophagaceae bacterium]|nr:hypothetical protein [Chitinophagaceae bacterium]
MKLSIPLMTILLFGSGTALKAQTSDAEAEAIVNLLGVQKKEAVAQLVQVSGKDSVAFWKVYDEYEKATAKWARIRLGLYERTAAAYGNMTPTIADSLASKFFVQRAEQEKSLETYYKKMKAAINPVVAFMFYQSETYLLTHLRSQIMAQIPTYGQLLKVIKDQPIIQTKN